MQKRKHMDKKILFVIAFLFSFAFSHAEWNVTTEVQNKKVLVEEFTGIHCGNCPYAHAIVAELLNANTFPSLELLTLGKACASKVLLSLNHNCPLSRYALLSKIGSGSEKFSNKFDILLSPFTIFAK